MKRKLQSTGVPPREYINLDERTRQQAELREGRSLIPPGGSRLDRFEQRPRKFLWKKRFRRFWEYMHWTFCHCNQLEPGSFYNYMFRKRMLLDRFRRKPVGKGFFVFLPL